MAEPTHSRQPDDERDEADLDYVDPSEDTALLPREDGNPDQSQPQRERSASQSLLDTLSSGGSGKGSPWKRRWPSLLALLILCLVAVLIMVFAFFAPSIVEQYAAQAVVFEPTSLSIDAFTTSGVRARIQGDFAMDASRVQKKPVRDLGKFGTWVARKVESGESEVEVSLPEYGNVVLGTAHVPRVVVDVRNGHKTHVDFLSDLAPGDKEGLRRIAMDWIDGRLGQLRVLGKATVPIKSGIFSFGTQKVKHELLFANKDIPAIPAYDIKRLNVHEAKGRGMEADVSLRVLNDYPVDFSIPALGFQILVDNCLESDPYILVADAFTDKMHIQPKTGVELNATGVVRKLPDTLIQDCPDSNKSPLDVLLANYMRGKENTIYVRGSSSPSSETPKWIDELIADIIVPVPLPGKTMGHLVKNFSLADTHFSLPDPFAEPSTPESNPRISAKVKALVALPEEMNFNITAKRVRADAVVFYKGDKLGTLDLHKWQQANSTRHEPSSSDPGPELLVESFVQEAPLNITDDSVFADVIQDLVFGGKSVLMHIKADVDVEIETALGEFKVRKIPAEGEIPVKPIAPPPPSDGKNGSSGRWDSKFLPKITDLQILDTSPSSLTLSALMNLTNPTEYAATVPYIDIHIMKNGSLLGHATARDLYVRPGQNDNLLVKAVYAPFGEAKDVGREFLSQYISGWNTTLVLKMHEESIPSQPALGKALSKFEIEMPTPSLGSPPSDPDDGGEKKDGKPHFIKDATFHLLTSTATFTLLSPLRHSTVYVENINATAFYKGEDVGNILYDLPFAVPPVDEDGNGITSPYLPVDWSLGSVGYEAVKRALGGSLKLAAEAEVGVRLGEWRERVWFRGSGIAARVRL
ncbi:hypothetical protein LTR37_012576 [Vermiconidia calcicola]|uniref:Uncharacterized protein n=1 Tax=Vermiconidia calcicola TaxID=1690605 RepID=A0ACC3MYW1_9PEZI|nr:hypothetical protein LTR37_012576 [Vermiconidia calcicola]